MKTAQKIQFVVNAVKWFDKVNGNTYHSCRIVRTSDGDELRCPFTYGYGSQYQQTALDAMHKVKWIECDDVWQYERENNYPIDWSCTDGKKRECIANGKKRDSSKQ